jgi:hypothetical protein
MHAYAGAALRMAAQELAATVQGGRHVKLLAEARKLGRYVHHGVLQAAEIADQLSSACKANNLWRDDGGLAVRRTIMDGIKYAAGDGLPILTERGR